MKKVFGVLLALVLMAGAGAGIFYYTVYRPSMEASGGRVSSSSDDAIYVDSVRMLAGLGSDSGLIQRFAGVVEPQETWGAKIEGDKTVKQTYVSEGDEVKVGDKLFTYDTSEDEDKLEQDEIDLERLQNELVSDQASIDELQRAKDKAGKDEVLAATTRLLQAQNEKKQDEFEIKSKELEIENLKAAINSADVTSELDGVVQKINKTNDSGNMYGYGSDSGSDAYITIMAVGEYRVKGTLNEQNFSSVYEGMPMLAFSRVDDSFWNGTVTQIRTDAGASNTENSMYYDSGSDSGNGSTNYPFYVEIENSEGLMLGQHVYLEADQGQTMKKSGIWLPDYYFNTAEDGSTWVWAASSSNVLEKRSVELGGYDEGMLTYEVLSGLDEEDYITLDGPALAEGLPVIYMDSTDMGLFGSDDSWEEGDYDITYFDGGSYDYGDYFDAGSYDEYFDDGSYDEYFDDGSFDYDFIEGDEEAYFDGGSSEAEWIWEETEAESEE